MKVNKINEKVELGNLNDVTLQGCYDDCTEYFQKTKANYNAIVTATGLKPNGNESPAEIREIKELADYYCYKKKTAKTCIYW